MDEKNRSVTTQESNYLNDLSDIEDDFDVEIKVYQPPPPFKKFALNPFSHFEKRVTIECKTGQIKLPKEIINKYVSLGWVFGNYHRMELMALLFLHYYKDCDEWKKSEIINTELRDIIEAIPHFNSISELLSYAYIQGDLKVSDFEQIIESDGSGSYDVTGLNDD